jgi:RimJ/RimL family protein N-acetyltransferase
MVIFETARMKVRPLHDADLPELFRLMSDPEVMRYVTTPYKDENQVRERMALWEQYAQQRPGLGTFAVETRDEGVFCGFCVARQVDYNPESDEFEIGYILAPAYWGKGLASELAQQLCKYCFQRSCADRLVAFTDPDNAASQRVLTKTGFQYTGIRERPDFVSAEFWLEKKRLYL